jgi:hypothetical protein
MIIGCNSIDPRRLLLAEYKILVAPHLYVFTLTMVVGGEVAEIQQIGSEKECMRWLKQANRVIGRGPLVEMVATTEIGGDSGDDDESCERKRIGFNPDDK